MNLKNLARRALVVAAVGTTLAAAGNAQADRIVPTHSPRSGNLVATAVVATAPRSSTAAPGNTTVKLAWLAPSSNGGAAVNKYRVQRATSAKGPWKTIAKPTVRRYRASGLTNGRRYYFRVAAHNAAGWGPFGKVVSAMPRTVPTAPRSPTAAPGNTTMKLAWLASSSNGGATIDRYRVERATSSSGQWTTIATPTTRHYTAGGLTNGKKYYFRVRAHNAAGWGPFSTAVNSVPRTVPTAPEAPYGTPGDSFVSLSWDSSSSTGGAAIDKYEAVLSTDQVNWTTSVTSTKWNNVGYGGLTNGTTYYFRVRAHNAAGWGRWSTIASAAPRTVPSAPVGAWSFYSSITSTVDLFWSPPANNGGAAVDHYGLEYSYDQTGWYQWSTATNTHVSFGVGPQLPDYWRVTAHNAAGYGPASNVVTLNVP